MQPQRSQHNFWVEWKDGYWKVTIWAEHIGNGTRWRDQVNTLYVPLEQGVNSPSSLLRGLAAQLELPLLERYRPLA